MDNNLQKLMLTVEEIGVSKVRSVLVGLCDATEETIRAWRQLDSPTLDILAEKLEKDKIIGWKLIDSLG